MSRRTEDRILIVLFLAPAALLYTLFVVYPGLDAFFVSLFEWRGMDPQLGPFVGLHNFIHFFEDPNAQQAVWHNLYLLVVPTLLTLVLALLFAEMIRARIKGGAFFQTVFFFPNVLSMVVVGILWGFILAPTFGLVNGFLRLVNLGQLAQPWLGIPGLVMPSISAVLVWMAAGYYMVLLVSAMKNIPHELYELADLEGANGWQQFWGITLPLVWDVLRVVITLLILGAIQQFALIWVLTEGGPNGASEVMGTFVYKNAFRYQNIGYGNAAAVIMFLIVFALSIFVFRWMARETVEY
jgi:N-acetylglucosamine transport system permease protein